MGTVRRKLKHSSASPPPIVVSDSSSGGGNQFLFWLVIVALCAGGYFYYQYQQEQNEQKRIALRASTEKYAKVRAENESRKPKVSVEEKYRQRKEKLAEYQKRVDAEKAESEQVAKAEQELAEREAKERAILLMAEELQERRKAHLRRDMHKTSIAGDEYIPDDDAARDSQSVVKTLARLGVFNAKPNKNAEYFICYCSADWCPHCTKLMPTITKEYKNMLRSRKVELVMVCCDDTLEEAKAYLKKHKLNCPAVWEGELKNKVFNPLPGYEKKLGIPYMFILNKYGELMGGMHGSYINQWEELLEKIEITRKDGALPDD